jgi:outer membrane receptor protein involved in Fe transport
VKTNKKMKSIFLTLVIGSAVLLPCFVSYAQEQTPEKVIEANRDTLYTMSLEELMSVEIVSASKFSQRISEAPSTVSVITKKQIQNYGWVSAQDVLNRQPGFAPSQDYERRTTSSRGVFESWNNNHMLMLIDGVPMNVVYTGTALTTEATPLTFSKSMEIIRGPGSALYGSNATNGVVSLNSVSAKDMTSPVEVRYRKANWNTNIADLSMGWSGKDVSVVSSFTLFNTAGYSYKSLDASNTKYFDIHQGQNNYYLFNKIQGEGKFAGWSLQQHEQQWHFDTGHGWYNLVPDQAENMTEHRRILVLKYKTPDQTKRFSQEYVLKYQNHTEDYNQRFIRNGDPSYPYGMTEISKMRYTDYFARAQYSYSVLPNSNLLGGVEYSRFYYPGADFHLSNVNLNTDFSPTANNEMVDVGSTMPWLNGNGYGSVGIYAQYNTPTVGGFTATFGGRYDRTSFTYNDLYAEGSPKVARTLSKFNPRVSLVYAVSDHVTFKLMGGTAFRSPSPFELFVGNSGNGTTNPAQMQPESIKTYEFASDIKLQKNVTWRANIFYTDFKNVIAYGSGNVLINLFSAASAGVENEVLFSFAKVDGFANYSYTKRMDEAGTDPAISLSKHTLTWYPQHIANAGMRCSVTNKLLVSGQAHYQGAVTRRESDQTAEYDLLRGASVKSWVTTDLKISYALSSHLDIGLQANNLLNANGYMFKTYAAPYDYRMSGRRLMIDVTFKL